MLPFVHIDQTPRRATPQRRLVPIGLVAAVGLALSGCATPTLESAVEVPSQFAATPGPGEELEVTWWERFGDPVLSGLVQRAERENRDIRIAAERVRAASAGETISRSWLMPTISGSRAVTTSREPATTGPSPREFPETKAGGAGLDVSWEIDLAGGLRAGAKAAEADALAVEHGDAWRAPARAERRRDQLLHAGWRDAPARDRARDLGRTGRDTAPRHGAPSRRPRHAVRRRARAVRRRERARRDSAARDARRRLAPPYRRADRRPGGQRGKHHAVDRPCTRCPRPGRASPRNCSSAGPTCWPRKRSWMPRTRAVGRPTPNGSRISSSTRCSAAGRWTSTVTRSGPARFTNVAAMLAMPIFNAGRTRAINDIAEARQREAVLHYEDAIVRALEDVENSLVAFGNERSRAETLKIAATSADAAFSRAQSLYDRGQIDLLPLLDAQRTRLAVRVSSNDSDTQLLLDSVQLYKSSAVAGRPSSPSPRTRPNHESPDQIPRNRREDLYRPGGRRRTAHRGADRVQPRARPRSAAACPHRRSPLRRSARGESLRRHRAVPSRSRPGLPRRRQGRRASRGRGRLSCAKATCWPCSTTMTTDSPCRPPSSSSTAAIAKAKQAESDRKRLEDAEDRRFGQRRPTTNTRRVTRRRPRPPPRPRRDSSNCARNQLQYTMLRAPRSGVITAVRFEIGQVVAAGQPVVSLANEGEPEIVIDVPEDHLATFKQAHYRAWLASAPDEKFEVSLRELAPQAAAQTRTFRARLKPTPPRPLPLGATATLVVERPVSSSTAAALPASSITQSKGQPALWVVHRSKTEPAGTVELVPVDVHGYRNDEVLVSGPPAGELVVVAGVHKMAPGLRVALSGAAEATPPPRARPPDEILQSLGVGARAPLHRPVPDPRDRGGRRRRLPAARAARRPELLRAVDDGDRDLAGRHVAADPGRSAEPHGEEVRADRPLREGRDVRAAGLRRHDPDRSRRHLEGRPARGLVPGAQEVQRHQARTARRRRRPDLQRRVRRRVQPDVRRQGRRHRPGGTRRHRRGRQAAPAQGADGQEGRRARPAGRARVRRVLARASRRPRHHAAADRREPEGARTASSRAARSTRAATASSYA